MYWYISSTYSTRNKYRKNRWEIFIQHKVIWANSLVLLDSKNITVGMTTSTGHLLDETWAFDFKQNQMSWPNDIKYVMVKRSCTHHKICLQSFLWVIGRHTQDRRRHLQLSSQKKIRTTLILQFLYSETSRLLFPNQKNVF